MKKQMDGIQLGNYSMGDQNIQGGEFNKLSTMGCLDAEYATFHDLNVLGEATVTDCKIDLLQVAGQMRARKGRIDMASVAGELTIQDVDCGSLHVLGQLNSSHSTCRILRYGKGAQLGLFTFAIGSKKKSLLAGDIQGETLENFFPLTLDNRQQFKHIINCGKLYANAEIECAKFFNFSTLSAKEINADMVYLYPCASVKVKEIHGSLVIIDPQFDEAWLQGIAMDLDMIDMINHDACRSVHVTCIEADEVVLDYVTCDTVRARKVTIGPHANIAHIEYEESCDIHPDANVKESYSL